MFLKAGGEYIFLRESFGKCMGFLSGWISLIVGFSVKSRPIASLFGLGTIGLGLLVYLYFSRPRKDHEI